jgi:uncharacterized membrane protein (DUF2068 family)
MDWSLYRCGRAGHITYAPDEQHLREQMHASTAAGDLWQCLRCGTFVPGAPDGGGPAGNAPPVKRGKQIRGDFILKLFAIERVIRVLLYGAVAYGLWRFASERLTLIQAFDKDLPVVRSLFQQLGFNVNHSLVHELHRLLHISPKKLTLVAAVVTALAVVSGVEAFALWQAKRWGEYFATIVTALGLPVEIYELTNSITITKIILLVLNLLLVVYLIYSRRLFGARGGKHAYENRLRTDSVIDEAEKAAAAAHPAPAVTLSQEAAAPAQDVPSAEARADPPPPPSSQAGPAGQAPASATTGPITGSRHASVTVQYNRPPGSPQDSAPPAPPEAD